MMLVAVVRASQPIYRTTAAFCTRIKPLWYTTNSVVTYNIPLLLSSHEWRKCRRSARNAGGVKYYHHHLYFHPLFVALIKREDGGVRASCRWWPLPNRVVFFSLFFSCWTFSAHKERFLDAGVLFFLFPFFFWGVERAVVLLCTAVTSTAVWCVLESYGILHTLFIIYFLFALICLASTIIT